MKTQFASHNFETLFESMPQIVFVTNAAGDSVQFNQRWVEYTGETLKSTSFESWRKFIHPDDIDGVMKEFGTASVKKSEWQKSYRLLRKDGVYRWQLGRSLPELCKDGTILRWIGTVSDIEDQKRAEEKVKETLDELESKVQSRTHELSTTNAFLDSVIENIPNMIFVKDARDLRFVRFNKAGEDLIGVSRNDLIGKNDFDLFPLSEATEFTAADRAVIGSGEVVDIPEEPISTKHQGIRTLHTKKLPVYDENGEARYLIGISEDVTDLKRLEAERIQLIQERIVKAENERVTERFRFLSRASALLGSSLDYEKPLLGLTELTVPALADFCSVQLIDSNGRFSQFALAHRNEASAKIVQNYYDKYPPKTDSPNGAGAVVRTGKAEMVNAVSADTRLQHARDAEHLEVLNALDVYSYICAPIRNRDSVIGVLTLVMTSASKREYTEQDLQLAEDIGERAGFAVENSRIYKEARALNRVKDEFLATLSHELRTPLNVIQGHAEILKTEGLELSPEEFAVSADAISRNAKTQLDIVSDLLDVSSIITGKISFKAIPASAKDVVNAAVQGLIAVAKAKGVELRSDLAHCPSEVLVDPTRLQQIIFNLISNALKFTPRGGRVDVAVETTETEWSISVTDNGLGIEKEFLPYVFDRFRQEDSSTTRTHGGLGLGLSIVRNLSELHGGTAVASSEGRGKGSCFRVTLPLSGVKSESPALAQMPERVRTRDLRNGAFNFEGIKVLLVEDSSDNRALVKRILKKVGADYYEADSAESARQLLRTLKPDVVISDIGMPEENGLEFMRRFRSTTPSDIVPAIALTAYVREEERQASFTAGFQAHVGKPISSQALLAAIESVLTD